MGTAFALVAYGLLVLMDLFLIIFWGRIAFKRVREVGSCWNARHDKYAMIAACLTLTSIGTGFIFTGGLVAFSDPNNVGVVLIASGIILLGLLTLGVAKSGFVWTVHLDKDSWIWRAFIVMLIAWTLCASLWVLVDPFHIYL
jgi:hypothetical protein